MTERAAHIVHRLNLEIKVPSEPMARRMYREAGALLEQYVLPKLEILLSDYKHDDLHIRLDRLTVDLDLERIADLEAGIKEQLAACIMRELEAAISPGQEASVDTRERPELTLSSHAAQITQAFLYFLQEGKAPWWLAAPQPLSDTQTLLGLLGQEEERFRLSFVQLLTSDSSVLQRMVQQCDEIILSYLISLVAPLEAFRKANTLYDLIRSSVGRRPAAAGKYWEQQFWSALWQAYWPTGHWQQQHFAAKLETAIKKASQATIQDSLSVISFEELLKELLNDREQEAAGPGIQEVRSLLQLENNTPGQDDDTPGQSPSLPGEEQGPTDAGEEAVLIPERSVHRQQPEEAEQSGWLAEHTGLILLHPFLHYFFMELGLLRESSFISDEARATAVHLLHYLATGREHAPDFELIFEKYLCGMSAKQITYRYTRLTEQMKSEAETLLRSVVKHWNALGNTSADGLREAFLQRKGKLVPGAADDRLYPEQKALDILLERIPWNISLVKLPWLKHMLHIEWLK